MLAALNLKFTRETRETWSPKAYNTIFTSSHGWNKDSSFATIYRQKFEVCNLEKKTVLTKVLIHVHLWVDKLKHSKHNTNKNSNNNSCYIAGHLFPITPTLNGYFEVKDIYHWNSFTPKSLSRWHQRSMCCKSTCEY